MKFIAVIASVLIGFSSLSCVTMNQSEYGVAATLHSPIAVEDENVSASLGFSSNEQWITFDVQNKSDSVIQLIVDVSSYAGPTSNSKLIPEGTH